MSCVSLRVDRNGTSFSSVVYIPNELESFIVKNVSVTLHSSFIQPNISKTAMLSPTILESDPSENG
jgi:hypothetical protein